MVAVSAKSMAKKKSGKSSGSNGTPDGMSKDFAAILDRNSDLRTTLQQGVAAATSTEFVEALRGEIKVTESLDKLTDL